MVKKDSSSADRAVSSGVRSEAVYQALRASVLRHELLPGQRLDTRQLAERLGSSTTIVRDAFNRLLAESLLVHVPSRGYFVAPITVEGMVDAYEIIFVLLRFGMEKSPPAISLAELGDRPSIGENFANESGTVQGSIAQQYCEFVESLFLRIVSLSGNELAIQSGRQLLDRTHFVRRCDFETPSTLVQADQDISRLVEALARQDAAAVIAARTFIEQSIARLPEVIRRIRMDDLQMGPLPSERLSED